MPHVYIIEEMGATTYVNTAKELDRYLVGREEPEFIRKVDPAAECNRLQSNLADIERHALNLRWMLEQLVAACPAYILEKSTIGKYAMAYISKDAIPPATSSERGGQQSYGV